MKNKEIMNQFLVETFNNLLKVEEDFITLQFRDLSVKEMHVIEAISIKEEKEEEARATEVARQLNVTPGTLTIAINALERKGYVRRTRHQTDRRVVLLNVTSKGKKAQQLHRQFHHDMVAQILELLRDDEAEILVKSLGSISEFFKINEE